MTTSGLFRASPNPRRSAFFPPLTLDPHLGTEIHVVVGSGELQLPFYEYIYYISTFPDHSDTHGGLRKSTCIEVMVWKAVLTGRGVSMAKQRSDNAARGSYLS